MKLSELRSSYPSLPQDTHDNMMRAARNASANAAKPRRGLRKVIVLALVLLLALASVAYAAVRLGIVDYLIWGSEPTEALTSYAQTLHVREEANDIAITVTGAMYDGEKLALSYTVENLAPKSLARLRISAITMGNADVSPEFSLPDYGSWIPYTFGMQELEWSRNPLAGGMHGVVLADTVAGKQEVVLTYSIERPIRPLVVVDDWLLEPPEDIEDERMRAEKQSLIDSLIACGVTIADKQHLDAEWWHSQGYSVVNGDGYFYWPEIVYNEETMTEDEYDAMMVAAYSIWSDEAQMEQTGEIVLRFEIDADKGLEHRKEYVFIDGEQDHTRITLPDCTVMLEKFTMTPLSTAFKFRMIPAENTREAAEALHQKYGWIALRDETGQELELAPMEYDVSSGFIRQDENGRWFLEWDWTLPGAITFPQEIHITARADIHQRAEPTSEQSQAFVTFAEKMRLKMK